MKNNKLLWKPEDHAAARQEGMLAVLKKNGAEMEAMREDMAGMNLPVIEKLDESMAVGEESNRILEEIRDKEFPEIPAFPTKMAVSLEGVSVVTIKGDKGDQGEKGDTGERGEKGDSIKGDKGDDGEKGEPGRDGIDGKNGIDGKDGRDGIDGIDGDDGKDGKDGSPDTPDEVVDKVNISGKKINSEKVEGLPEVMKYVDNVSKYPQGKGGGGSAMPIIQSDGVKLSDHVTTLDFVNLGAVYSGNGVISISGNGFVPYIGATADVDLGTHGLYNGDTSTVDTNLYKLFLEKSVNDYFAMGLRNSSMGDSASTDITASNDADVASLNGHYANMGINGSGYVAATVGNIDTVSVASGGSGYSVDDILTILDGDSNGSVRVLTIDGSGVVLTVAVEYNGTGYQVLTAENTSGGTGTGCTINVDSVIDNGIFTPNQSYFMGVGGDVLLGGWGGGVGQKLQFFTEGTGLSNIRATLDKNLVVHGVLGTELAPSFLRTNWTLTAGWDSTNSNDTALNKNADGVTTATPSGSGATPVTGKTYKIVITVGDVSVASGATWTFGGVTGNPLTAAGTYTSYITATSTGKIIFTPTPTATRFTITGLSIKEVTASTGDITAIRNVKVGGRLVNPDGTVGLQISPAGASVFGGALAITGALTGATTGAFSSTVTITRSPSFISLDGLIATSTLSATATAPVQLSPRIRLSGTVWDTTAGASRSVNWKNEVVPFSGAVPQTKLVWGYGYNSVTDTGFQQYMALNSRGTLDVMGTTFGSESLTNGVLTSGTSWSVANGFTLSSNRASYAHNVSGGTLTQTSGNLAVALNPNRMYKLTYTTSSVVAGCLAYIDTDVAIDKMYLPGVSATAGTYDIVFRTNSSPTDFKIYATSTAGSFNLDTLSLVEVQSGDIIANGMFTGGGNGGLKIYGDNSAEFSSTVKLKGYTVATLPAGAVGQTAYVTDALAPAYGVAVAGGGAVTVPVFFNGAAWICA